MLHQSIPGLSLEDFGAWYDTDFGGYLSTHLSTCLASLMSCQNIPGLWLGGYGAVCDRYRVTGSRHSDGPSTYRLHHLRSMSFVMSCQNIPGLARGRVRQELGYSVADMGTARLLSTNLYLLGVLGDAMSEHTWVVPGRIRCRVRQTGLQ